MASLLAVAFAPAMHVAPFHAPDSWLLVVMREALLGVPVAVGASVSLWAAVVAGAVGDAAAGTGRLVRRTTPFGGDAPPLSLLVGLAASIAFLAGGGVTRLAARLAASASAGAGAPLEAAVMDLATGVGVGASIGAPLLVVGMVVDLASAIVAREQPTARGTGATLRTLIVLVAAAVLLDRMAEAVVVFGRR
jgi:type III secretory pathway component EscT